MKNDVEDGDDEANKTKKKKKKNRKKKKLAGAENDGQNEMDAQDGMQEIPLDSNDISA